MPYVSVEIPEAMARTGAIRFTRLDYCVGERLDDSTDIHVRGQCKSADTPGLVEFAGMITAMRDGFTTDLAAAFDLDEAGIKLSTEAISAGVVSALSLFSSVIRDEVERIAAGPPRQYVVLCKAVDGRCAYVGPLSPEGIKEVWKLNVQKILGDSIVEVIDQVGLCPTEKAMLEDIEYWIGKNDS